MGNLGGIGEAFDEIVGSRDQVGNLEGHRVGVEGVSATVDLEWGHACGCIGGIVACKFGCCEVEVPVVLFVTSECT